MSAPTITLVGAADDGDDPQTARMTIPAPTPIFDASSGSTLSPRAKNLAKSEMHTPAGTKTAHPTIPRTSTKQRPSAELSFPPPAVLRPTPSTATLAGDHIIGGDHCDYDNRAILVAAEQNIHNGQVTRANQTRSAVVEQAPPGPANLPPSPILDVPVLVDPALALYAEILDDLERTRNANANRLRQLTWTAADKDGEERGFGLDESHPDVARLAALVDALAKLEHEATLNLQRAVRKSPLGPWVKAQRGVGEKQAARLLAAVGDPYWNTLHDRPRTVSELWAYSGYHVLPGGPMSADTQRRIAAGDQTCDPGRTNGDARDYPAGVAAKRRKGQKANWSTVAKTRAYLIAESCIKQIDHGCKTDDGPQHAEACGCSPYRVTYDDRRAHTAVTHEDWSDGHSHNDAMRIASKAILRDLWREAKRIHEGDEA